jgi:hypothetical protein
LELKTPESNKSDPYLLELGSVIGCGPSFSDVMARGRLDVW